MRHKYSNDEHKFIIDNVKGITLKELTMKFNKKFGLNLSENAIAGQKNKLGLRSGIVGGRFEKGQTSFNKGKRWSEYMSEEGQRNSRKTTFKKGNVPANARSIGSERDTKRDGMLIKVQNGHLQKKLDAEK